MAKLKTIVFVAFALFASAARSGLPANAQAGTPFFEEDFGGPLDPTVWRTEELLSGPRWCADNAGCLCGPGRWIDVQSEACHSRTTSLPYGSATVSGVLQLGSAGARRAFPYLASRYPGDREVFPATEDFRVTIRLKYDLLTSWGTGVVLVARDHTEPTGNHSPTEFLDQVLAIWADPDLRVLSASSGTFQQIVSVTNPDAYHEYSMDFVDGACSVSIDGALVYGPIAAAVRPKAILIGNPAFSYWGLATWSAFSLDRISVELLDRPTLSAPTTWGRLKSLYR